ncbi:hypothetical protein RF11_09043 [Thelohanellus kitauei]|uniref:Uncharacterized protein n=1 Tax=Thelohanellus kitauei TaxID=669202 RepID=A0A0C2IYW1_THEKT|nr:hypothetical protein RF11_09043 [Thelohanellus kitauei]
MNKVILRPNAHFDTKDLDYLHSDHDQHSCIVIMSTSIIMELKIFKNTLEFPGTLLYEFNFTGFRTECTKIFFKRSNFHIKVRIIDVFYNTFEENFIEVIGKMRESTPDSDFQLLNVVITPFESITFSYDSKSINSDFLCFFAEKFIRHAHRTMVPPGLIKVAHMDEYLYDNMVFEVTFTGFYSYGRNNQTLIAERVLLNQIEECKNRTFGFIFIIT